MNCARLLVCGALAATTCGPASGGSEVTGDTEAATSTSEGATGTSEAATEATPTGTEATPTGTEATPTGTEAGTSDGTTGEHVPVMCMSEVMDHAEACPTEPCAITVDVAVRCEDGEFAAPGVRVAAGPEATWMVTASATDAMLFAVAADGATRADVLPARFQRETILLATAPSGELHVLSQVPNPDVFSSAAAHLFEGDGWAEEVVYSTGKGVPVLDMEVDVDGTPHLWFVGDAPDQHDEAVPDGQGGWAVTTVETPKSTDWRHFTRSSDGRTIAAGFRGNGNGSSWSLISRSEGVELKLGTSVAASFPFYYVLAPSPLPDAPPGPSFAAAIQHAEGVRVAWPTGPDSDDEVLVLQTGMVERGCFANWDEGCPGPCEETDVGLEEAALSLARTSDGVGWLVWVETHLDQTLEFTEACQDEIGCYCNQTVTRDDSFGVLKVARVPLDGTGATEVLAQRVDPLALVDLFIGWSDTPRAIDARAFGSSLAIGLRTQAPGSGPISVRTLRVELDQLP